MTRRITRAGLLVGVVYVVLCLIWSSTWLGIKIGLHGAPPLLGAGLRFLLAAACFAGWRLARRETLAVPRDAWGYLAAISTLTFAVPYVAVYLGETQVTSGLSAVLFGSMPFFAALLGARFLPGERLTVRRLAGTLTGIAGLGIVFHGALTIRSGGLVIAAILALVLSPAMSASGQAVQKAHGHRLPITLALGWAMGPAGLAMLLLGLATEPIRIALDARTLGSIAFLGIVGSVVAFALYFWLLRRIGTLTASMLTLLLPILALVEGAIVYDEPLNWWVGAGTAVVAGGMGLVLLPLPSWPRTRVDSAAPRAGRSEEIEVRHREA